MHYFLLFEWHLWKNTVQYNTIFKWTTYLRVILTAILYIHCLTAHTPQLTAWTEVRPHWKWHVESWWPWRVHLFHQARASVQTVDLKQEIWLWLHLSTLTSCLGLFPWVGLAWTPFSLCRCSYLKLRLSYAWNEWANLWHTWQNGTEEKNTKIIRGTEKIWLYQSRIFPQQLTVDEIEELDRRISVDPTTLWDSVLTQRIGCFQPALYL